MLLVTEHMTVLDNCQIGHVECLWEMFQLFKTKKLDVHQCHHSYKLCHVTASSLSDLTVK